MSRETQTARSRGGMWARASDLAARTPETRNRYVDFLRALSIFAVVFGHWLMAGPYVENGAPHLEHLLDIEPWARGLTWVLQVMPVFFFVGGFSNGTSWESARRKNTPYRDWLVARLRRLVGPVLPLIFAWAVIAAVAHGQGVHPEMIRVGSRVALVPVWFLAVYILVVLFVPLSHAAWKRYGLGSLWPPIVAALLVDVAFFALDLRALGWLNYLFVWLTVHQLGYAWRDGRLEGVGRGLALSVTGLAALVLMVTLGPYPVSLVGVPSQEISNTLPPKMPLLALAAFQIGLLLALELPMRRWLARHVPWTLTVLVNGMIMTVFLWHSTVMMLLIGLAFWVGGVGLEPYPGTRAWWILRPPWVALYATVALPFILVFARFERPSGDPPAAALWRVLLGCAVTCVGLALLALDGVGGDGWLGLRIVPLLLPVLGTGLAGFGPLSALRSKA